MRQFRMPIHHTKNLSKFKRQIGTILKDLNTFDEQEKYEAFSYLQGCISAKRVNKSKLKLRRKRHTVTQSIYKCKECTYTDTTRKGIYSHLESHPGFPLSCRSCRNSFQNNLSFEWHLQFHCRPGFSKKYASYMCTQCPRKFYSQQNLRRHLEGHKRNNCTYCDQVITNRKHLIQHLIDVHSIKLERAIFKCTFCDKRYVKRRSLYYHKQQHFKDKSVCLDCGVICKTSEDLSEHQKEHEEQKQFKCITCNQKFSRRQQYLYHMKKHDNYKCITCKETFASKMKMLLHKRKGHNVEGLKPKFSCPDCGKDFFQKSKLMFHLRKHTEDKPTLNCQYCDKTFQSPYAYYKHSTTVSHEKCSPETSIFVCESCGSQFPKKYLLEQHTTRVHINNREYVNCEFCSYKTKNKANMKRHRDTHITNGKTFICDQCGKDFNNIACLKGHMAYIHTENKHFKCDQCEKIFKRNSELVRHQGTHSDSRPHVCALCGQSYKRLTHLRRHEKSSHKIELKSRVTQKLLIESDGTLIPVEPIKKKDQQLKASASNMESTAAPLISLLRSEPLALVKKKDSVHYADQIVVGEAAQDLTYFENICTNNTNSELNILKDDIILDMSLMGNTAETHYFLNTQYTNDQLIQEYIGHDNMQFVDNNPNNCIGSLSTTRYVSNSILSLMDSQNCKI